MAFDRKTIKLADFIKEAKEKYGEDSKKWKFKCAKCGCIQSAEDFAQLSEFENNKQNIGNYVGFSCIGRFDKGKGCDWTLGGLFTIHTLEIEDEQGKKHPHFELA